MRLNDVRSYYKKKITLEFPAKEKWLNFKSWMTARSNYAKGLSGGNKIKFQENRWKKNNNKNLRTIAMSKNHINVNHDF